MAIAVFSDIHGNLEALQAVLKDCKKRRIKKKNIFFLGDAISMGINSRECITLIEQSGINVCMGNHEQRMIAHDRGVTKWSANGRLHFQNTLMSLTNENLNFIKRMPIFHKIYYKNYRLLFTHYQHGYDGNVMDDYVDFSEATCEEMFGKENCNVVFFGHVHHRNLLITGKGRGYVCVGSSGLVQTDTTFYTLFDIKDDNYDIKRICIKYNRKKFEEKWHNEQHYIKTMFADHFGIEKD
ncbi:MAG: metallophosphoesterase family protein [Firmicutes bacterium]|nr:metallophosphoesterase family protein [Bacillota bacterium]